MPDKKFNPGSLVKLRNREWVVQPSNDEDLLVVKPLGGTEEESTAIYLPMKMEDEIPESCDFPPPGKASLGNFSTAKILYNAARLSFRNVAGPFRSMGRYSFRPRSYQVVPLVMALRQDVIRLLIADDVGVGKTIEALMIARELLDRGEIKRFAVVCLPHLCEQWQQELKDKFSIDAEIVRSSTAARLDRMFRGDESLFRKIPFQVVSIDFIKADKRRSIFISDCPELIIVDEAHTCTRPAGASPRQQQRFGLIYEIARKKNQHLLLLTATPHSGKQESFQSLIGLLKPEYEQMDIVVADQNKRLEIAQHIVIRRRADVAGKEEWNEKTSFPQRDSNEIGYLLSEDYKILFQKLLDFARSINISNLKTTAQRKFRYFAILALLRGVMSSPAAGIEMLSKKAQKLIDQEDEELIENPVADKDEGETDAAPDNLIDKVDFTATESSFLKSLAKGLETIKDNKAEKALGIIKEWLKEDFNPIVFCRFIPTAKYLGEYFKDKLPANVDLLVITGEMVDEERKEKIDALSESINRKLLISTDCLSEGINLQEQFDAVLHYDLTWNPNRLEQREGRVDRFGQSEPVVKTTILWGEDNPIDSVVLNILIRKAREIRRQTGISVPFPEDNQGIIDSLLNAVILNPNAVKINNQYELELFDDEVKRDKDNVTKTFDEASERNKKTHSIFAQHRIKLNEIEKELKESDEAVGDTKAVKNFVIDSIINLGAQFKEDKHGYVLFTTNLPGIFKPVFNYQDKVQISFESPTPEGYKYIGRNHPFVEQLCQYILNNSLSGNGNSKVAARASVISTSDIEIKTTILQLRVRNIIAERTGSSQLIAEEMILWGFKGNLSDRNYLTHEEAKDLIEKSHPSTDLTKQRQEVEFENESSIFDHLQPMFKEIVKERSGKLIESHERFRKLVGGSKYQVAEPVLPPDILGVYILLPVIK